jgi:hemerythrin-like domain-containing protein
MSHRSELRQELASQHQWLEATLGHLLTLVTKGESRPIQDAWTTFEAELVGHMDFEEHELLPLVEPFHSEEVRALRADHDRIRDIVYELGLRCDLHMLRKESVERVARLIRAHAAREDETLYPWLEAAVPADSRHPLLHKLRQRLGQATGSASSPRVATP